MYAVVMFLYTVWTENGGCVGSIRGVFVSSLKCYQFGECFRLKEVIRSTVVLKKEAIFLPALASHWFFSCCPLFLTPDMDRLIRLFWLFRLYKCEIRPIIYGHPEAIVGKLRKLLYCEDVRRNMRAVVIEEAHLERCRMASIWYLYRVISIYYTV